MFNSMVEKLLPTEKKQQLWDLIDALKYLSGLEIEIDYNISLKMSAVVMEIKRNVSNEAVITKILSEYKTGFMGFTVNTQLAIDEATYSINAAYEKSIQLYYNNDFSDKQGALALQPLIAIEYFAKNKQIDGVVDLIQYGGEVYTSSSDALEKMKKSTLESKVKEYRQSKSCMDNCSVSTNF